MITQTKLDQMVEDIKAIELDKNPVSHYSTDFTKGHILTVYDDNRGEEVAIGTIKDFWLPELFCSAPELALEVKQLREELELYKTRYLKMTEGMDWQEENEMWSEEE